MFSTLGDEIVSELRLDGYRVLVKGHNLEEKQVWGMELSLDSPFKI